MLWSNGRWESMSNSLSFSEPNKGSILELSSMVTANRHDMFTTDFVLSLNKVMNILAASNFSVRKWVIFYTYKNIPLAPLILSICIWHHQVHMKKLKRSSGVDLFGAFVSIFGVFRILAFSTCNIKASLQFINPSNKTISNNFLHCFPIKMPHFLVPKIHIIRLYHQTNSTRSCLTNSQQITVTRIYVSFQYALIILSKDLAISLSELYMVISNT